ncbi:laccase domain-containing protein, partial [Sulfuricurvum sp. RIFOXYD12_FULL_44_77]|uniref:polyphenol oxidase family protein n=1 Tax=Sulfuricurvum sp. RIFOXYD12_FULL_44_77 TaxID=1802248 RepID=UPI0025FEEC51
MKTVSPALLASFSAITAAFTSRHGGISKAPYTDANLAFHVGDNPEDVVKNHDLLADKLGFNRHSLIHMRQIHSDRIVIVDETLTFDAPPECDALITNRTNTPLMVMSADCTGVLLYDPIQQAIGAVHAGRSGALHA